MKRAWIVLAALSLALSAQGWAQAPKNVQAVANGPTTVQISWDAEAGAAGYDVFRGPAVNGPWTLVSPPPWITQTTFTDNSAPAGSTVAYYVAVYMVTGGASNSEVVTVTTPPQGGGGRGGGGGANPGVAPLAGNPGIYKPVPQGNAGGGGGRGIAANPGLVQSAVTPVAQGPPKAPEVVKATAKGPTTVEISWSAAAGATGYRVQRKQGGQSWIKVSGWIPDFTYTDTTASPGKTYGYRVEVAPGGAESEPAGVTTPAGLGGGPAANPAAIGPVQPGSALGAVNQLQAPAVGLLNAKPDLQCEIQASETGLASDWDLSHTSVQVVSNPTVWLRLTLKNGGAANAGDVDAGVSIKVNTAIILFLGGIPAQNASVVPVGASVPLTPFPLGLKPGINTVEIKGIADPDKAIAESNDQNNECVKTYQIQVPNS